VNLLDVLSAIIVALPVPATMACVFLWWFHLRRDKSWVSKWWAILATMANITAFPVGWIAARRLFELPPLPPMVSGVVLSLSFIALEAICITIAVVVAYHYFVDGPRKRRRVLDHADTAREKRQDARDDAREVKLDKQDAAREVERDAADEVREEQHKERNE
jgi:hypothetical protein